VLPVIHTRREKFIFIMIKKTKENEIKKKMRFLLTQINYNYRMKCDVLFQEGTVLILVNINY